MTDTVRINLVMDHKRPVGFDPVLIFMLITLLAGVSVFYLYSAWLDGQTARARQRAAVWESRIGDARKDLPRIAAITEENRKLTTQIQAVQSLSNDPIRYANLLFEMGTLMPRNAWITGFNVDPGRSSVSISGTAVGDSPLETVAELMRRLSTGSRCYQDATLSSTTAVAGGGFTFQLDSHYDATRAARPWPKKGDS